MNQILHQMNSLTAPARKEVTPSRQIGNYFGLLKNMSRLGLQLVIERKHGLKHFAGIIDDAQSAAIYDDIVGSVMHPDEADSAYFHPEEIDAIAETLSNGKLSFERCVGYLRTIIASRLERLALDHDGDGDTHVPTIDWAHAPALLEDSAVLSPDA